MTTTSRARIDGPPDAWGRMRGTLCVVECELNTDCNRSCIYCPQSKGLLPASNQLMEDVVLDALLGDLARIGFSGRFSHHLYGEPLLHPALAERVRRVGDAVPGAVQVLFTNGDLLTDDRHAELLDAGIALFAVTRHQPGPYPTRAQQAVQYARDLQFTSRAGSIDFLLKKKRKRLETIKTSPCLAPTEMLVVGWDGKILRCYEDARREEPLGDLRTHTLGAIWAASEPMRQALTCGARVTAAGPCSGCDNTNHTIPGQSVATEPFWESHPEAVSVAARALGRLLRAG